MDEQVFWASRNPAVTTSESWPAATLLLLLTVTACAGLVEPMTVDEKVSCDGVTFSPDVARPPPLSGTVIWVTEEVEEEITRFAVLPPEVVGANVA